MLSTVAVSQLKHAQHAHTGCGPLAAKRGRRLPTRNESEDQRTGRLSAFGARPASPARCPPLPPSPPLPHHSTPYASMLRKTTSKRACTVPVPVVARRKRSLDAASYTAEEDLSMGCAPRKKEAASCEGVPSGRHTGHSTSCMPAAAPQQQGGGGESASWSESGWIASWPPGEIDRARRRLGNVSTACPAPSHAAASHLSMNASAIKSTRPSKCCELALHRGELLSLLLLQLRAHCAAGTHLRRRARARSRSPAAPGGRRCPAATPAPAGAASPATTGGDGPAGARRGAHSDPS